ncbi:MAG: DUF2877 domain-containing protein [Chloroflexi bacterium]|nr:DUF2877 domain-containing protein [Chloroflexota bacterium]
MVRARSIASPTLAWLRDPKPTRVLHVFKDACNLIAGDGEILSLVMPYIGDGPFNIILEPLEFSDHISVESAVSFDNGQIRIGALEIGLTPTQIWEPRFDWESFRGRQDSLSLSAGALREVLVEVAPVDSFVQLIHSGENSVREIEAQILLSAQEPARFLVQGLLIVDEKTCRASARKLAGLGAGLTPDGDDFMMGCILATWAYRAGEGVEQAAKWVSLEADLRTTPLAAAWLRAASRGESSVRWHDLLQAILIENEENIRNKARAIIQQGHTSGASALVGFTAVLAGDAQQITYL